MCLLWEFDELEGVTVVLCTDGFALPLHGLQFVGEGFCFVPSGETSPPPVGVDPRHFSIDLPCFL